jgi:antitoxin VapB
VTLNVKDREAHALAQALAKETGETMTRAVTEALRERLERVRRQRRAATMTRDLLAIGKRCAATLKNKPLDHGSLLFDNQGLPR